MSKISSVSGKSTGFPQRGVSYSDESPDNTDPGNPHPMNAAKQNPVTMGKDCGCEYKERPTTGIDMMGVGNFQGNDAARERLVRHPTAEDKAQAGSLGGGGNQ